MLEACCRGPSLGNSRIEIRQEYQALAITPSWKHLPKEGFNICRSLEWLADGPRVPDFCTMGRVQPPQKADSQAFRPPGCGQSVTFRAMKRINAKTYHIEFVVLARLPALFYRHRLGRSNLSSMDDLTKSAYLDGAPPPKRQRVAQNDGVDAANTLVQETKGNLPRNFLTLRFLSAQAHSDTYPSALRRTSILQSSR